MKKAILILILTLSFFLSIYRLSELMIFIGDQGWFFISARDLLISKQIPLVGIASSHTWLHQGPLWTYFLAIVFFFFNYNPLAAGYVAVLWSLITVFVLYKVSSLMFSEKVGLISAALYATSPLVINYSRMPYHTIPIPLFTLCYLYSLYKWINGNSNSIFFPFSIFFLGLLYNFELATVVFGLLFFAIFFYGILKKRIWAIKVFNKRIILFSFAAFIIPMFPILIYDFTHGFLQTGKFMIWIVYKTFPLFGYPKPEGSSIINFQEMVSFFSLNYQNLIFPLNGFFAFLIFISSFTWFSSCFLLSFSKNKKRNTQLMVMGFSFFVSLMVVFLNKTPSQAYLHMFFPLVIMITAIFLNRLMQFHLLVFPVIIFIALIAAINSYYLISENYFMGKRNDNGPTFAQRLNIAKKIVKISNEKKYNLLAKGSASKFESFTMNYEYLTWWLGKPPSKQKQQLKFIIDEKQSDIDLKVINDEN